MTAADRLRTLTGEWDAYGLGGALEDVARQIERERACDADAIENVRLVVGGVVDEMEYQILGVEGMEDSPVARWARELREALVGERRDPADLLPQEERDAIAWVRDHGGLDEVKSLLDWVVGHCSTNQQLDFDFWLSGRVMCELGFDECMADRDEVKRRLLARLMPEGYSWPAFEDGALVRIGDEISWRDEGGAVNSIELQDGGYFILHAADGADDWILPQYFPGERVKRPAPKVLDADGVEIRVGDTVWHVETGERCKVVEVDSRSVSVDFRVDGDGAKHTGSILPANLTHRAPVLAADGLPLREGETVWHRSGHAHGTVESIDAGSLMHTVRYRGEDGSEYRDAAKDLTHERPAPPDSWSRLEEDAKLSLCEYNLRYKPAVGDGTTLGEDVRVDIVRRARALAGGA